MELIDDITTLDPNGVPVSGKLITWQQFHARFAKALKKDGNDEAAIMDKLVKTNSIGQLQSMMEVENEHLTQEHALALASQSKRIVTAQESLITDVFNEALIDTIEITNAAIKKLNLDHQTNLKIAAKYIVYIEKRKEFDLAKAKKRAAAKLISSQSKKTKRTTIDSSAATNLSNARGDVIDDNIVSASVVPPLIAAPLIHTSNDNAHADNRVSSDGFPAQLLRVTPSKIVVIDVDESPKVRELAIVHKNTPDTATDVIQGDKEFFFALLD